MKTSKKVFVSSSSDRGILVKFLKDRVSLSFWGNDDPKNISYSKEEAEEFCKYILEGVEEDNRSSNAGKDIFNQVCEEMVSRIPPKQRL